MSSSLVQALLAFLLIVIAIPVALVTLRRVRLFNPASRQVMRLAGGIALGPRERIAVVEVGGRWLVVGVTGQSINLLTTLDSAPADLAVSRAPRSADRSASSSGAPAGVPLIADPTASAQVAVPGDVGGGSPFARLLASARRREAH